MTVFSQRDPRWASKKMGKTSSTLGMYGCLVTCFGIISDIEPDKVNDRFTTSEVYQNDLVIWTNVSKALPWLKLVKSPVKYDNNAVLDAISKYGFCLIEVDFNGVIDSKADNHWVVFKGDKQLIDPWDGAIKATGNYPVLKRYVVFERVNDIPVPNPVEPIIPSDGQFKVDLGSGFGVMELNAIKSQLSDLRRDNDNLKNQLLASSQELKVVTEEKNSAIATSNSVVQLNGSLEAKLGSAKSIVNGSGWPWSKISKLKTLL